VHQVVIVDFVLFSKPQYDKTGNLLMSDSIQCLKCLELTKVPIEARLQYPILWYFCEHLYCAPHNSKQIQCKHKTI